MADPPAAIFAQVQGDVRFGVDQQRQATVGDVLRDGSQVDTGKGGRARLLLQDGSEVDVFPRTTLVWSGRRQPQRSVNITLAFGQIWCRVQKLVHGEHGGFEISSANAVAGIRGTTFGVHVSLLGETRVQVSEGAVAVASRAAPVLGQRTQSLVQAGQELVAKRAKLRVRAITAIEAESAVDWRPTDHQAERQYAADLLQATDLVAEMSGVAASTRTALDRLNGVLAQRSEIEERLRQLETSSKAALESENESENKALKLELRRLHVEAGWHQSEIQALSLGLRALRDEARTAPAAVGGSGAARLLLDATEDLVSIQVNAQIFRELYQRDAAALEVQLLPRMAASPRVSVDGHPATLVTEEVGGADPSGRDAADLGGEAADLDSVADPDPAAAHDEGDSSHGSSHKSSRAEVKPSAQRRLGGGSAQRRPKVPLSPSVSLRLDPSSVVSSPAPLSTAVAPQPKETAVVVPAVATAEEKSPVVDFGAIEPIRPWRTAVELKRAMIRLTSQMGDIEVADATLATSSQKAAALRQRLPVFVALVKACVVLTETAQGRSAVAKDATEGRRWFTEVQALKILRPNIEERIKNYKQRARDFDRD